MPGSSQCPLRISYDLAAEGLLARNTMTHLISTLANTVLSAAGFSWDGQFRAGPAVVPAFWLASLRGNWNCGSPFVGLGGVDNGNPRHPGYDPGRLGLQLIVSVLNYKAKFLRRSLFLSHPRAIVWNNTSSSLSFSSSPIVGPLNWCCATRALGN